MALADGLPATRPRRLARLAKGRAIDRQDVDVRRSLGDLAVDGHGLAYERLERMVVPEEPGRPRAERVRRPAGRQRVAVLAVLVGHDLDRARDRDRGRRD